MNTSTSYPHIRADGPVSSVEQTRHVFHELHADGRHDLCAICCGQHGRTAPETRELLTAG